MVQYYTMASSLVLLLFSLLILYVNGHVSEVNKIHQNYVRSIAESELRHQNEILWMGQLAPISLQVKTEAQVPLGKTNKYYRRVRVPMKLTDRQVRKKSGIFHKSFKRGLSRADKQARRALLVSHDLFKQGIIGLDKTVSRSSKRAHDSLKRSSSWLDDKLVAGTRQTHRSVKRGLKPVDRGLAVGSVRAYSTVKKGVTSVDRRLKVSAKAIDKQLTSGTMKKVPVTLFLNKFVNKKGKKSKPVAALPAASEPELKESEVHEEFGPEDLTPFEVEEPTPSSTPISSKEGKHSEELFNYEGVPTNEHEEREEKEKEEEKDEKEDTKNDEEKDNAVESKNEEPADFEIDDFDGFEDAKHEDHDHHEHDHNHPEQEQLDLDHENFDNDNIDFDDHLESPTPSHDHHDSGLNGEPRSVQKSGKKRYFNLGKFDGKTLKQFAPRSSLKAPKSLQRSFAKISILRYRDFTLGETENTTPTPRTTTVNLAILQRAFLRILCSCCPRKVRRRHRHALRYRPSQYSSTSMVLAPANVTYATVSQKELFSI